VHDTISFDKVCSKIATISTASKGDVQIVIACLLEVLSEHFDLLKTIEVEKDSNEAQAG
jgi:hypothetical protein